MVYKKNIMENDSIKERFPNRICKIIIRGNITKEEKTNHLVLI